jgi:hypothetical protein
MKTRDLIGPALDWAVARAKGIPAEELRLPRYKGEGLFRYQRDEDGNLDGSYVTGPDLLFSRKWEAGGPIIERELISVSPYDGSGPKHRLWEAHTAYNIPMSSAEEITGPTPLIAAMRCYVSSKFGPDIDIPKGIANENQ